MSSIQYRPEVDGLRALAVIPVVLFHLGAAWMPGGFVGVDVFFVISGYLITSIILREQEAGSFTFSGFWMRRVRRILPALLAMLSATSIAGYFLLFGPAWYGLGQQVISAIGLYANVEMWQLAGNYWGPAAESAPLLHTWSLSVEEQFYLFYPLLLLTLLKATPKWVFPLILAGTVASFLLGLYATNYHPNAAFYFLPTRAWELAAGCLLAIFERSRGVAPAGIISRSLALAGLLLILAAYFLIQGTASFPGFWALLPVIGSVLVIRYANNAHCFVRRILSWPAVVYIGKCSYSLYLWHWPVIVIAGVLKLKYPDSMQPAGIIVVICLLTLVSYHFIEKPTRKMKGVLLPVCCGLVLSLACAVFLLRADYEYDLSASEPTYAYGGAYDVAPLPPEPDEITLGATSAGERGEWQYEAYRNGGIIKQYGGETPEVVVLGSSHGIMWAKTIDDICKELGLTVSFYTARAIPPWIIRPVKKEPIRNFTAEQRYIFDSERLANLQKWSPRLVILADRWSVRGDPFLHSDFIEYIGSCGAQVLVIGQPPEIYSGGVSIPLYVASLIDGITETAPSTFLHSQRQHEVQAANARLQALANTFHHCHFLPVYDLYEGYNGLVLARKDRQILYLDEDHLSQAGADIVKRRLFEIITDLL